MPKVEDKHPLSPEEKALAGRVASRMKEYPGNMLTFMLHHADGDGVFERAVRQALANAEENPRAYFPTDA